MGGLIVAVGGRVVEADEQVCARLGRPRAELVGCDVVELFALEERGDLARQLRGGAATQVLPGRLVRGEGPALDVELEIVNLPEPGSPTVCVVRDASDCRAAQEQLRRQHDARKAIAAVLELGLTDVSLDELLQEALDLVLDVPWLSIERAGAIFRVEQEPGVLVRRVQRGLSPALLTACSRVPFGQCLCGLAAATRAPVHAERLDARHSTRAPDVHDHGHYVVPIRRGEHVFGVLCTYLAPGHRCEPVEVEFLEAVANALAGVLLRRGVEEERRQAQEQLAEAQRMRAVGHLAAGVAHDFGNLLTIIRASGVLLRRVVPPGSELHEALEALLRASSRGTELTRQLLDVGRGTRPAPVPLVLDDALRSLASLARQAARGPVELDLAAGDAQVALEPGELERVVVNLVANARDAVAGGGRITLRSHRSQGRVVLEVADTGMGMTEEVRARIFDPYFTTKPAGQGSGLGLPTTAGIVRGAGGEIQVESAPGQGSTFRLSFPVAGPGP